MGINKTEWEYLAHKLAFRAGIDMAESKIEKVSGNYHTFFTKRFDRLDGERIHFASAMTMTGNNEDTIRGNPSSYLELAEFIQFSGAENTQDLHQVWRRIVFHIAIPIRMTTSAIMVLFCRMKDGGSPQLMTSTLQ